MHPHAAGIEVGVEEHGGWVPADRARQPLQTLRAFPWDWPRLADWLTPWRSTTVVRASTGVSGMPLCHLLEARGFAVALVNARHVTQVPGRPHPARCDGRWRPQFPSAGWLAPSWRPPEPLGQRRRLLRPRDHRLQRMVKPRQPRPKALDHRHLPRPPVMRDVTGVTGRRRLRARVAGARAPPPCAQSRDSRMPSRPEPRATAREGDARSAPLCTLPPSLARADLTQQPIAACAQDIARVLSPCAARVAPAPPPWPPPTTTHRHPTRHAPACDLRTPRSRLTGVDRTHGPG